MKLRSTVITLTMLLVALAANGAYSAESSNTKNYLSQAQVEEIRKLILTKTNAEREKKKLKPLKMAEPLQSIAQKHTENMCSLELLEHEDKKFPKGMQSLAERLKMVQVTDGGENVALRTFDNADKWATGVVTGWMNSQGHRKNILHQKFEFIGIGIIPCNKKIVYATQVFSSQQGRLK